MQNSASTCLTFPIPVINSHSATKRANTDVPTLRRCFESLMIPHLRLSVIFKQTHTHAHTIILLIFSNLICKLGLSLIYIQNTSRLVEAETNPGVSTKKLSIFVFVISSEIIFYLHIKYVIS